jgi:hypothetical protein
MSKSNGKEKSKKVILCVDGVKLITFLSRSTFVSIEFFRNKDDVKRYEIHYPHDNSHFKLVYFDESYVDNAKAALLATLLADLGGLSYIDYSSVPDDSKAIIDDVTAIFLERIKSFKDSWHEVTTTYSKIPF